MTRAGAAGLSLSDGLDLSGLSYFELWVLYIGLGGAASSSELADLIAHDDKPETALDAHDHNMIAQALNEHFLDLEQDHPVAYRESPTTPDQARGASVSAARPDPLDEGA